VNLSSSRQTRGTVGSSAMLANTANDTAGTPINHDCTLPSVSIHHTSENNRLRDVTVDKPISLKLDIMYDSRVSSARLFHLLWQSQPHDAISRLAGGVHIRHQNQIGARKFQSGRIIRRLRSNGDPAAVTATTQRVD